MPNVLTPEHHGHLDLDARALADALRPLTTKQFTASRVGLIQIAFEKGKLIVKGTWFGAELPATGQWPGTIQLPPNCLLRLLRNLPDSGSTALVLHGRQLALGGRSVRLSQAVKIFGFPTATSQIPDTRATPDQCFGAFEVLVGRSAFENACAYLRRNCDPKPPDRATFRFQGDQFEIAIAGLGQRLPATGNWHGTVEAPAAFMLGVPKLPPPGDPLAIRIQDGRLHIGPCSVKCNCSAEPGAPQPIPTLM